MKKKKSIDFMCGISAGIYHDSLLRRAERRGEHGG